MSKPVVGVIGNARVLESRFPAQVVGEKNLRKGKVEIKVRGSGEVMGVGLEEVSERIMEMLCAEA